MTTKQTYIVDLQPSREERDSFELSEKNLLSVRVQLPSGEMIGNENYRVEIILSRDAMLGLGTELIRAAHKNSEESNFWHLHPCDNNLSSQILGVYLHPDSCELLVSQTDFDDLQTVLDS